MVEISDFAGKISCRDKFKRTKYKKAITFLVEITGKCLFTET